MSGSLAAPLVTLDCVPLTPTPTGPATTGTSSVQPGGICAGGRTLARLTVATRLPHRHFLRLYPSLIIGLALTRVTDRRHHRRLPGIIRRHGRFRLRCLLSVGTGLSCCFQVRVSLRKLRRTHRLFGVFLCPRLVVRVTSVRPPRKSGYQRRRRIRPYRPAFGTGDTERVLHHRRRRT